MILHYIFLLGISVEAVSGAIAAGRKRMDFFGVIFIGCVAGLGGGTVRDIVFNTHPISWVAHPNYLLYTSGFALLTICIPAELTRVTKLFLVLDALGLAAFTIIGTQRLLTYDMPEVVAILGGLMTGISGGMLRDILCNDIPLVLRSELYAIIAMFGAIIYVILNHFEVASHISIIVTVLFIFITRLLAIWLHLEVPKFNYSESMKSRSYRWKDRQKNDG
ncbi:MAG: trimeric intracellular cation channel family protein [Legionellaceae bacterium]|nr:trimeric intracellular cation channel family protein [Legionellaceae bacterium]